MVCEVEFGDICGAVRWREKFCYYEGGQAWVLFSLAVMLLTSALCLVYPPLVVMDRTGCNHYFSNLLVQMVNRAGPIKTLFVYDWFGGTKPNRE